jgi:hypothetical protein
MTHFTYTVNLPSQNPVENARSFVRLPRSILLTPYLAVNPYFVDYTDAIDAAFDDPVDAKLLALKNIRNMWVTTKGSEEKIANGEMLSFSDWGGPDRATVVSQVNLLGLQLSNAGVMDDMSYRALARFLGSYWYEKGKKSFVDFLSFCTNVDFSLVNLWTSDYVTFIPESDVTGTTIFNGGTWYPTTHVRLKIGSNGQNLDIATLSNLFNEVANYNLVLESVASNIDLNIVTVEASYLPITHSSVGGWAYGVGNSLTTSPATQPTPVVDSKVNALGMAVLMKQTYSFISRLPG